MEHIQIFKIIIALMVLINPLSAAPIFLSLTPYNSARERRKIAQTASITVAITICIFALVGDLILRFWSYQSRTKLSIVHNFDAPLHKTIAE